MTETERIDHVNAIMSASKQGISAALANDIPVLVQHMNDMYTRKGILQEAAVRDTTDDGVAVTAAETVIGLFNKTLVDILKLNCRVHKNLLHLVGFSCILIGFILGLLLAGVLRS
jgi:hypothetical protein